MLAPLATVASMLLGCVAAPLQAAGGTAHPRGTASAAEAVPAVTTADIIAGPLPPPSDPALSRGSGIGAFADFALRQSVAANQRGVSDTRHSALLSDPSALSPIRRKCAGQRAAVLIDLDPAGKALELNRAGPSASTPALANRLRELRSRDITVFWISSHGPGDAARIRDLLEQSGLDPQRADPLVLMRFPAERKQERRMDLGDTVCLLAIAGDERSDFDELYEYLRQDNAAFRLEQMIGAGWFLTPPPLVAKDSNDALDP